MPEYPSGTVAFLFTDIEGSTKRWERDSAAMWAAVERHIALLRAAIAAHDGVHFKTIGDAVQAAFPTVPKAVAAAIAAQVHCVRKTGAISGPCACGWRFMPARQHPSDGDYLAPALNRLARVLGTGYGEQILLTETARALLARSLAPPATISSDLGRHRLRDLLVAERIFQLSRAGTGGRLPAAQESRSAAAQSPRPTDRAHRPRIRACHPARNGLDSRTPGSSP